MKVILYATLIVANLFACFSVVAQQQDTKTDEFLFVRRIMEFWKDHEHQILESQIKQFVKQYPHSEFVESLYAILGDSFRIEKKYAQAIEAYEAVKSLDMVEKVFAHRMDCLYHLGNYQVLSAEVLPRLPEDIDADLSIEQRLWLFYYAESLLLRGKTEKDLGQAKHCFEQALPYFNLLVATEHKLNAKLALAEIAIALGDPQQASSIYLELAESYPEKKEEVLYYAARVQSSFDPMQALFLFSYVQGLGGPFAADAAMNKTVLMYEQRQYSQILQEAEELKRVVDPNKHSSLNLVIGQCRFALKQYEQAAAVLHPLLAQGTLSKSNERKVLLLVAACAYQMNDLTSIQALKIHFNLSFPKDPAFAHLLYLEALAFQSKDRLQEAKDNLEKILRDYPSFEKTESVEFEHAVLLFKKGNWEECRQELSRFIQSHPSSLHYSAALQQLADATIKRLESLAEEDQSRIALNEELANELQLLLKTPDTTKRLERPKLLLKLCQTLYELKRYDAAAAELKSFIQNYPHDEKLFQAHLLAAMCAQRETDDGLNFIHHVEKVLQLKPEELQMSCLRLTLFKAYMQLAAKQEEKNADSFPFLDKGAEHLFVLMKQDRKNIVRDQQIWLANFYYEKARGFSNDYAIEPFQESSQIENAEKAIEVALYVMQMSPQAVIPTIGQEDLYLEYEFYKLSNLYGWVKNSARQIEILRSLAMQQNNNPGWDWNLRPRVLYALAFALQQCNEMTQAKEIYAYLSTLKAADPYVLSASNLQLARFAFDELPPAKKKVEDPDLMAILKQLKDLQTRRVLAYEPIHLEAGLEYARMRASLEPKEKQAEHLHYLLTCLKMEFTSQDNIMSKEYHLSRQQSPGKDLVYQAYMMLIDATLARLEASRAGIKGKMAEKQHKDEAAKSIYANLISGKFAVTNYLVQQARSGLDVLETSNGLASRGL